mgnify:FL=1
MKKLFENIIETSIDDPRYYVVTNKMDEEVSISEAKVNPVVFIPKAEL